MADDENGLRRLRQIAKRFDESGRRRLIEAGLHRDRNLYRQFGQDDLRCLLRPPRAGMDRRLDRALFASDEFAHSFRIVPAATNQPATMIVGRVVRRGFGVTEQEKAKHWTIVSLGWRPAKAEVAPPPPAAPPSQYVEPRRSFRQCWDSAVARAKLRP